MEFIITDEAYKLSGLQSSIMPSKLKELTVLRNEIPSFQLFIKADKKVIVNIGEDLGLSNSLNLPRIRVEFRSELKTRCNLVKSLKDNDGIMRADILDTGTSDEFGGNMPVSVWVDVLINNSVSCGEYIIEAFVYLSNDIEEEKLIESKSIKIKVIDFVMPDPKDYTQYIDLWQHPSNVARQYNVKLWSDEHFKILEKIIISLSELGQKSIMIIASDCPWKGWFSYIMKDHPATLFEYSIIKIVRLENGEFYYDFSIMQRYIDLCKKYNIDKDISIYGILGVWESIGFTTPKIEDYPEDIIIRYKDLKDNRYKYLKSRKEIIGYLSALLTYLKNTDQLDITRISADEPKNDEVMKKKYIESMKILKEIESNVKFKIAFDNTEVLKEFYNDIDDCATSMNCTIENKDLLLKGRKEEKRNLWYVCNLPDSPNSFLSSYLLETRMIGIMSFVFGVDGFLRWAYNCWTHNPTKDIRYNKVSLPAGDLCFIYPGKNGDILKSLRWKALKRGFEDYELLKILEKQGKKDIIDKALSKVLKNLDILSYMKSKRVLNEGIISIIYKDYVDMRNIIINALMD